MTLLDRHTLYSALCYLVEDHVSSIPGSDTAGEIVSDQPSNKQNRRLSDLPASRGFTLNDFTGDSLLHYSYSVTGRGEQGLTADSQLGKQGLVQLTMCPVAPLSIACDLVSFRKSFVCHSIYYIDT